MKRKSLLFLLLFALIAPWAAYGQGTTSTTVYDGTTTNNYVPAYIYYFDDFTRSQFVIPADDLETLGDGAVISAVTFYADQAYPASDKVQAPVDVYLKEVSYTSISAFEATSSATTVYSGVLATGDGNVMTITFTNPYTYHNGNLLIGIENTEEQSWQNVYFYGQNVTGASFSGSGSSLSGVYGYQRNFIPKTTLTYVPGVVSGCIKPTLGEAQYISEEGASFQWTENGTATQWQLQYSTSADFSNPTTLDRSGIPALAVTGLSSGTTYYFRLRSYCGDGEYSNWSNTVTFTTLCGTFGLPYAYGFEDAGQLNCWIVSGSTSTSTGIASASDAPEGSKVFKFHYSEHNAYLISPVFDGTNAGLYVTFQYMNNSTTTSYTEQFQVGYTTSATETDPTAFTYGETIYGQNEWVTYENVFPANTKRIAIKYIYTNGMYLRLDDFNFEAPSGCMKPSNLATGEVGKRSATIRWTENGEATAWQVEVTDLDGGQVTTWNANATSFEIVGLTPGTRYSVRVNPVCDVDKWSDAITFTTEVACPAPELTIVETTPVAATFSWTGEAQGYEMEYMVNPSFTFEDGTLQGWTNLIVNADGGQWLHSNDNPGGYIDPSATDNPYYPDLAHNGTGFAMCYSFIDNDGAYNTNAYLVSPRSYQISAGASMNFWYDMANDTYPEYFEVCVATAANPTADDFTAIWTSDAKGSNGQKAAVRHRNHTRYQNWREVTIDLSAYVGQTIWVAFHDVNEDMYEVWIDDVMIDDGTIEWTPAPAPIVSPYTLALEPGTEYLVRVRAICGGEDGESAWTTVTVTTPSNCDTPFDLNVTNLMPTTATLNWTGYQDGYEVRYRTPASQEVLFFEGFEGLDDQGLPEGWTSIDNDGDGNDWYGLTGFAAYAHGGDGIVTSASYAGGALTPDNWLVTPQIALQGTMKVYLRAQDPSYAAEGYAIYLSTTGNTVDDFTVELYPESFDLTGEYKEITADLSSYNGQMGYIAIRHFDCEDMFRINVDDFGIYGGETPAGEWNYVTTGDLFADIIELHPETAYEWQVRGENRSCTNGEEEGYTAWSEMGTFTTPGLCDNPNTFVFEELTATSATLTWTGYQESYNVQYRTAEVAEYYFEDWFEEDLSNWTEDNAAADNSIYEVGTDLNGYVFFVDADVTGAQTLISTEMEPTASGTVLEFYTASTGTSTYKIGFSSTDNALASFNWSEELTSPDDNYFHPYEGEVPEGTKYFAIQFVSNDTEDGYFIVTAFDVYNLIAEAGEWVELTVNEPSVTMEPLVPETLYEVYVQGICGEEEYTEAVGGYFTTPELTTITQTTNLNAGWNWFSAYVEGDAVALIQALENSLGDKGITIKASEISTDYYDDFGWFGELDALGIVNEQMYLINVSESCTVELQGTPANPANHAITINPGWNWIGFPSAEAVSVAAALAGFEAEEGDVLKGSELSTDYYGEEFGWFGGLQTLEPGQGYLYKYNGTTAQTLIFQTGAKRAATTNTLLLKKQIKDQKHNAISRKMMSTKNGVVYNKFQAKVGYNKSIVKNYQQAKLNYKK